LLLPTPQTILYFQVLFIQISLILLSPASAFLSFHCPTPFPSPCTTPIILNFQFLYLSTSVKLPDHQARNQSIAPTQTYWRDR
jgi:hypothetical protein